MITQNQVKLKLQNEPTSNATEKFKFSTQKLVNLVRLSDKREFSEEIDELEVMYKSSSYFQSDFFDNVLNNTSQSVLPPENDLISKMLLDGLASGLTSGINSNPEELLEREQTYGHNRKEIIVPKSFWSLLWDALQDPTLIILTIAALVSIGVDVGTASEEHRSIAWIEGFAILMAVVICSTVTAANDYKKEKQFQKLNAVSSQNLMVTVIRDGVTMQIHRDNILVGDLLKVKGGMELPSDGIVITSVDLKCDESVMTGEPDAVVKQCVVKCIQRREEVKKLNLQHANRHEVPSPIMMSGTNVVEGEGLVLAIVVGPQSTQGKIDEILQMQEIAKSPLQEKLETIATDIGKFGFYSAILIVIILLIRFTVERIQDSSFGSEHIREIINIFIIGITVIVVAIPEGLPLSVTLSLAFSTQKMLKDKNLVRKIQACETMGGANNICSDKTGTLTQNKMFLTTMWNFGEKFIEVNNDKEFVSTFDTYLPKSSQELFIQLTAVNSTATVNPPMGDATEQALIKFLDKNGVNFLEERTRYQELAYLPFSSQRKRMTKIIQLKSEQQRLLIKGASELITQSCSLIHRWDNDEVIPIDLQLREQIQKSIISMAEKGLRTIGIAYKQVYPNDDVISKDAMNVREIEKNDLVLFGLLGIEDILREEVPLAIKQCKQAQITVRMVTGDNKITAKAIARKCGIITEDGFDLVMEGKEFIKITGGVVCKKCKVAVCGCPRDKKTAAASKQDLRVDTVLNQEQFREIYPNLAVMARSAPEDKYTLVVGLMENGNIVAVTGDGSNDAPALKKADVGFAMGIAGTQVAKNAADIILTDDNFSSIVKAVMWGRNIYDSIRKFLQFQLTVNIVAVFVTLIGGAVIKQELLQPIQLLWINLIMDTFASLALATEPPQLILLERPPYLRTDYIISRKMLKHILLQSVLQIIVVCIFAFAGEQFLPEYSDDFDKSTDPATIEFVNKYKYRDLEHKYMHSGRLRSISGTEDDYSQKYAVDSFTPSRHFTMVFNVFVWLQFFNFLNSRKINDEFNIFQHIFSNMLFFGILFIIIALQILFVQFGFRVFFVYKYGLTIEQWFICIGFGATSLIWSMLIKLIPDRFFPMVGNKQTEINFLKKKSILNFKRGKSFEFKASGFGSSQQFQKFREANHLSKKPTLKDNQLKSAYSKLSVEKQETH